MPSWPRVIADLPEPLAALLGAGSHRTHRPACQGIADLDTGRMIVAMMRRRVLLARAGSRVQPVLPAALVALLGPDLDAPAACAGTACAGTAPSHDLDLPGETDAEREQRHRAARAACAGCAALVACRAAVDAPDDAGGMWEQRDRRNAGPSPHRMTSGAALPGTPPPRGRSAS